jgi:hypothetical protein
MNESQPGTKGRESRLTQTRLQHYTPVMSLGIVVIFISTVYLHFEYEAV